METTLAGKQGIRVYPGDIIASRLSSEERAEQLEQVLFRLESVGLKLRKEKCAFAVSEAMFLGLRIDAAGNKKMQEILDAPESTGKLELQAS